MRDPRAFHKSIFDPVHGSIALAGAPLELIGCPEFQRLWGIRQTGFAHLVFPGANHTRLEHSLGVYWVAESMARTLGLSTRDAELVTVGGLLHDVGHGPFSHTFEPSMREVTGSGHERRSRERIEGRGPWTGPDGSGPRLRAVLDAYGIDAGAVADLVDPRPSRGPPPLPQGVLHGAIDADRIDYLQRDAHYTGVAHGAIDAIRLIGTMRAHRRRLAFAEKGRSALEGFLVGRSLMYSSVYYHKTVRAAEVMAQSAVERLPDYPDAARELFDLTDGDLLVELRRRGGRAAALIDALLVRRLYKRVIGLSGISPNGRTQWLKLARSPARRRQAEDVIADVIGIPRGEALLDLAGLEARAGTGSDWGVVAVLENGRPTYPFRSPSLWHALAGRSPTISAVSLYVAPKFRKLPEARLRRALGSVG